MKTSSVEQETVSSDSAGPQAQVISRNPATGEIVHRDSAVTGDALHMRT